LVFFFQHASVIDVEAIEEIVALTNQTVYANQPAQRQVGARDKAWFALDSPLEGGVSCELVSENAKFPASWEYTGNFIDSGLGGASRAAKNDIKSVPYGPIP